MGNICYYSVYFSYLDQKSKLNAFSSLPLTVVGSRRLRLVIKDLLNLLQNSIVDLLVKVQSLEVILELLNLGSTQDNSADVRVLEGPGERELGDVSAETLGDFCELLDLLDLGLAGLGLELVDGPLEERLVGGEAGIFGDAVVVLSGQKTAGKRGPDGGSVLELVVQGCVLNFEALTVEGVVLRLLNDCIVVSTGKQSNVNWGLTRSNKVVALGDVSSLGNLSGAPL